MSDTPTVTDEHGTVASVPPPQYTPEELRARVAELEAKLSANLAAKVAAGQAGAPGAMVGMVPQHPHFLPTDPPQKAKCTICYNYGVLGHFIGNEKLAGDEHAYNVLYCEHCKHNDAQGKPVLNADGSHQGSQVMRPRQLHPDYPFDKKPGDA